MVDYFLWKIDQIFISSDFAEVFLKQFNWSDSFLIFTGDTFFCQPGHYWDPLPKELKATVRLYKLLLLSVNFPQSIEDCLFYEIGLVSLDDISNLEEFFHKKYPKITFTDNKRYVKNSIWYLFLLHSSLNQMSKFRNNCIFLKCI